MDYIDKVFSFYDNLIGPLPLHYQALISAALVVLLAWNIYAFIKKGHWVFVAILIILLPGTWPAVKNLAQIFWTIVVNLVFRIQGV